MIVVRNVCKRYTTAHGVGRWVLDNINLEIPRTATVGLIGRNGAGKSTLLNLIGGTDQPTKGTVERLCRVSFPLGLAGGLQGTLTGRQNARFVVRLFERDADMASILAGVQEYSELGKYFDEPVKTYSTGMQARLRFALSLAFEFDMYLVDEVTAVGDAIFRKKSQETFRQLAKSTGLIMVSHDEKTLRDFCSAGILLHEGRATWHNDVNEAIRHYKEILKT